MSGVSDVSRAQPPGESGPLEAPRRAEAPPPQAETPPPTVAELDDAAKTLNRVLEPLDMNVHIHYDAENRAYRVKIVDRRTKEVIREIPNRGVLEAARQAARGLFVDQLS